MAYILKYMILEVLQPSVIRRIDQMKEEEMEGDCNTHERKLLTNLWYESLKERDQ
jgi:hypothetical protein